jgi:hypothetical protein
METKQQFMGNVYQSARSIGMSDAQARLAASQAALETDYGKKSVGNNYFGIKAGSKWNGPSVTANTWEEENGQRVNQKARFRSYSDPSASLQDWASSINKNWPQAYAADDFNSAVEGLGYGKPGGYASDSGYGKKLRSIDRKYNSYTPQADIPNVPTPTSAPDIQGILSGNYSTPKTQTAPVQSVQRAPLKDASMPFDAGRFGPQPNMQTVPELKYDRFAAPFDQGRFAPAQQTAQNMNSLRRGLLDQQLNAGILPSLVNPAYAAMAAPPSAATAYVDPQVTAATAPAVHAPQAIAAATGYPASPSGLLSDPEYAAVQAQKAYLDQQPFNPKASQIGGKAKALGSGILGALLGGAVLGPVGGILGGLIAPQITKTGGILGGKFPEAPKSQSKGDGSLTSYGKSVSNSSGQFSRALASGGKGLY